MQPHRQITHPVLLNPRFSEMRHTAVTCTNACMLSPIEIPRTIKPAMLSINLKFVVYHLLEMLHKFLMHHGFITTCLCSYSIECVRQTNTSPICTDCFKVSYGSGLPFLVIKSRSPHVLHLVLPRVIKTNHATLYNSSNIFRKEPPELMSFVTAWRPLIIHIQSDRYHYA